MARDRSLRMSFTAVSSAAGVNQVRATLGTQTAIFAPHSTANGYGFGYSDQLNLNRFPNTLGDAANFAAQSNPSADGVTPPLGSSTSDAAYYIRTAVGQTGFSGPRPQTLTIQSASSTGVSAPSQSSDDWANCGSTIYLPATCSFVAIVITDTAGTFSNTGLLPGSVVRVITSAASLTAGTHYLVSSGGKLVSSSGAALTTTAATVNCYVSAPAASTEFTVSAFNATTGEFTASAQLQLNDAVVFSSVSGTAVSANTMYFVNGLTANGFTLSTSVGGSSLNSGTITGTSTGFFHRTQTAPVVLINNATATTLTARNILSGTAVSHGLAVGDIVVFQSGTITGSSAGDAFYVSAVPSLTTFEVSTTLGGASVSVVASGGVALYPVRSIRLLPIQIEKTSRQWIRLSQQTFNGANAQTGHMAVLYADVCPGRDGSYALR